MRLHGLVGIILFEEFLDGFGASAGGVGFPGVVSSGRVGQEEIRATVRVETTSEVEVEVEVEEVKGWTNFCIFYFRANRDTTCSSFSMPLDQRTNADPSPSVMIGEESVVFEDTSLLERVTTEGSVVAQSSIDHQ